MSERGPDRNQATSWAFSPLLCLSLSLSLRMSLPLCRFNVMVFTSAAWHISCFLLWGKTLRIFKISSIAWKCQRVTPHGATFSQWTRRASASLGQVILKLILHGSLELPYGVEPHLVRVVINALSIRVSQSSSPALDTVSPNKLCTSGSFLRFCFLGELSLKEHNTNQHNTTQCKSKQKLKRSSF